MTSTERAEDLVDRLPITGWLTRPHPEVIALIAAEFDAVAKEAAERMGERCAVAIANIKPGCTCGAVDIGVGNLHEPGCGSFNPDEAAVMLRALPLGETGKEVTP